MENDISAHRAHQSENTDSDSLQVGRRTYVKGLAGVAGVLGLAPSIASSQEEGGPVVLMGLDSEEGAGVSSHGPPEEHAAMVQAILNGVTNGGEGILVIGGGDSFQSEQYWGEDVGANVDADITFVTGPDEIRNVDFGGFAMIGIASSTFEVSGGLTDEENEALIDRANDIAAFVNNGGGLLGKTQDALTNEWAYIDRLGEFETQVNLGYVDVEVTPEGEELGFTQEGMSGWCCWHDVFLEYPDFLEPLVNNAQSGSPGEGEAAALGGVNVVLVEDIDLRIMGPDETDVGATEEYDVRLRNVGNEDTPENVQIEFTLTRGGGITADDIELEYYDEDAEEWTDLLLNEDNGSLSGTFGAEEGFPLPEGYDETIQLRVTFTTADEFTIQGDVVGVGEQEDHYADTTKTVQVGETEPTASVTFDDQDSDGNSVVVQQATLPDGGYLVVHASDDGTPGAVLGHSAYLSAGDHSNVEITLDEPISSTQTLIAMAHTDDGDQEYEFPDTDGPYTADGQPVIDDACITVC